MNGIASGTDSHYLSSPAHCTSAEKMINRESRGGKHRNAVLCLLPSPFWRAPAQHLAHILVHDPGQCLRRCEGDILFPRFNEGDVLLQQAGALGQLTLCQSLLQPSCLQVRTKDCHEIVRVRFTRRKVISAAFGH
jgi:hypothetical protein